MLVDFAEPAPQMEDDSIAQMILTYVPEAESMSFPEAWLLARERDWDAAIRLEESVLYG